VCASTGGDAARQRNVSQIDTKRMVDDGPFSTPPCIGERSKGWLASDVKRWIETLNEQRSRPRQ
jgi:predicted DNA-binding transcriptional regulator AlpA